MATRFMMSTGKPAQLFAQCFFSPHSGDCIPFLQWVLVSVSVSHEVKHVMIFAIISSADMESMIRYPYFDLDFGPYF